MAVGHGAFPHTHIAHCKRAKTAIAASSASQSITRFFQATPPQNKDQCKDKCIVGKLWEDPVTPQALCDGIAPFDLVKDLPDYIRAQFQVVVGDVWQGAFLDIAQVVWWELEKIAAKVNMSRKDETCRVVLRSQECGAQSRMQTVKVPLQCRSCLGDVLRWKSCQECAAIAKVARSHASVNSKVFIARIITHHLKVADPKHIPFLNAVKHSGVASTPYWRDEGFALIKKEAGAKQDFLEFKQEEDAILPADLTKDWKSFLLNVRICILQNKGDVRNKVLTAAFNSFIQSAMLDMGANPQKRKGLRHKPAFKSYCIATSILSSKSARFDRINLFDSAAPHPRNVQRAISELVRSAPSTMLDLSEEAIAQRAISIAQNRGLSVVSIAYDELVNLKAFIFNRRHGIVLGGDADKAVLDYEEDADLSSMATQLANKTKVFEVVPQSNTTTSSLSVRPGGGDSAVESLASLFSPQQSSFKAISKQVLTSKVPPHLLCVTPAHPP